MLAEQARVDLAQVLPATTDVDQINIPSVCLSSRKEGAVEALFDKGVLHLAIKKPAKAVKITQDNQYQRQALLRARALYRTRPLHRELCVNLGDGADQAAWLCLVGTTSMPSANLTPATIFGN